MDGNRIVQQQGRRLRSPRHAICAGKDTTDSLVETPITVQLSKYSRAHPACLSCHHVYLLKYS